MACGVGTQPPLPLILCPPVPLAPLHPLAPAPTTLPLRCFRPFPPPQVAQDMRAQLAEQEAAATHLRQAKEEAEAAAAALVASKDAAEAAVAQMRSQLSSAQEQAAAARQRADEVEAYKKQLAEVRAVPMAAGAAGDGGDGKKRPAGPHCVTQDGRTFFPFPRAFKQPVLAWNTCLALLSTTVPCLPPSPPAAPARPAALQHAGGHRRQGAGPPAARGAAAETTPSLAHLLLLLPAACIQHTRNQTALCCDYWAAWRHAGLHRFNTPAHAHTLSCPAPASCATCSCAMLCFLLCSWRTCFAPLRQWRTKRRTPG
jgi:hypothetical protein